MGTALSAKPVVKRDAFRRPAVDVRHTAGFVVIDRQGRLVGKAECPMYGSAPDTPDALSVRSGLLSLHRLLVPAETIEEIDPDRGVIRLRIARESIKAFL